MVEVVKFEVPSGDRFIETDGAVAMFEIFGWCQTHREIGLVVGDPGLGKTAAARRFAAVESHRRHFVPLRHDDSRGLRAALRGICEGLNADWGSGWTTGQLSYSLRTWMQRRSADSEDTRHVVLVDEAQYLPHDALDLLRSYWDDSPIGIVFLGNNIFRKAYYKGQRTHLAPFASRLGPRLDLTRPSDSDVAAVAGAHEVRGAREVAFLKHHAAAGGGLRTVVKLIGTAERLTPGEAIRLPQLEAAAHFLGT